MRMLTCVVTTLLSSMLMASAVQAQAPVPPPVTRGYYSRAYMHFLQSNSPVKTYSSSVPGYQSETFTPYSYQSSYRDPAYEHQRVDQRGFEHYYTIPGYGRYSETPFYSGGYDVGGREVYYTVPRGIPYGVPYVPRP